MTDHNLQAAVSAGVMSAEEEHRALLQSIVEVARAFFSSKAASIFLHDEDTDELVFEAVAGELQVLDRAEELQFGLGHMELLGLFANQAAIALDLLQRARHARSILAESGGDAAVVARIASVVEGLDEEQREPVLRLLGALDEVLRADVTF